MKWKLNSTARPKKGDTRTVTRFAWLPKRLDNCIVWLTQYEMLQVWHEIGLIATAPDGNASFFTGQWVTVGKKPVRWQAL